MNSPPFLNNAHARTRVLSFRVNLTEADREKTLTLTVRLSSLEVNLQDLGSGAAARPSGNTHGQVPPNYLCFSRAFRKFFPNGAMILERGDDPERVKVAAWQEARRAAGKLQEGWRGWPTRQLLGGGVFTLLGGVTVKVCPLLPARPTPTGMLGAEVLEKERTVK